jgi:hypothetical protein
MRLRTASYTFDRPFACTLSRGGNSATTHGWDLAGTRLAASLDALREEVHDLTR